MRTTPTLSLSCASLTPLQIRSQYSIARSRVLAIMHVPSYTRRIMPVLALLLALVVSTEAICCNGKPQSDPSAGPMCLTNHETGCWECGSAGQPQQCVKRTSYLNSDSNGDSKSYCSKQWNPASLIRWDGCNIFGCNCDGGCSNSYCPSVRRALMSESQHPWTNTTAWFFLSE